MDAIATEITTRPGLRARPRLRVRVLALGTALAALALSMSGVASAEAAATGQVKFLRNATSAFDQLLVGSTPAQRQWMGSKYFRMRGYPPFFDQALGWAPPTQFYKDLYAIYNPSEQVLVTQHPDWVLRDASGQQLYIEYDCSGGTCPQYAADVGNPEWRAHWIADAGEQVAKGYEGIFIDDVNLEMRISNGNGVPVRPTDPRTGQPMTDSDWRRYMAEFLEEIRAAFPDTEITHNPHWWLSHSDPFVQRQTDAADVIELERGFNDRGIHGGGGTYGFETYLAHVDWLHSRGKSVIYEPYGLDATSREFELASYFLVQDGDDMIASDHLANPNNFWTGWEADLGAAAGPRYAWNGLLRRDFAGGTVLVNQPNAAARTIDLAGEELADVEGAPVATLTLGAREAAVLLGTPAGGGGLEPEPEPETVPPPEPAPAPAADGDGTVSSSGSQQAPEGASADGRRTAITVSPRRKRVRRGGRIVLRGTAPESEAIEIQAKQGGGWRTLASDVAEDASFQVSLPARRAGVHRFRANLPGAGASTPVRVRVRS